MAKPSIFICKHNKHDLILQESELLNVSPQVCKVVLVLN